jgi:hypothetical protein
MFRLLDNGDAGIGTASPGVRLHVVGGSDASATGGGFLQIGPTRGQNVVVDDNEIMARDNGAAARLNLNAEGGDVAIVAGGGGNVGIGTNSPAFLLEVDGAAAKPGGMKAVTVRGFEALAVEALRELTGDNQALACRNEELEQRNDELEQLSEELETRLTALESAVERLAAQRD